MSRKKYLLEGLLEDHDQLEHLECDGLTRVASYTLKLNGIGHKVYQGSCTVGDKSVEPHFWIRSGDYTIDYRLRRWFGDDAPHGVFKESEYPRVVYDGIQMELSISEVLYGILIQSPPIKKKA